MRIRDYQEDGVGRRCTACHAVPLVLELPRARLPTGGMAAALRQDAFCGSTEADGVLEDGSEPEE